MMYDNNGWGVVIVLPLLWAVLMGAIVWAVGRLALPGPAEPGRGPAAHSRVPVPVAVLVVAIGLLVSSFLWLSQFMMHWPVDPWLY